MPSSPFGLHTVNLQSDAPFISSSQLQGAVRGFSCQTAFLAPYNAVAIFQKQLTSDWISVSDEIPYHVRKASLAEYKYNYGVGMTTSSLIPAVRVACSAGQNIPASNVQVTFPVLPEYSCWTQSKLFSVPTINTTRSANIRATWTSLNPDFGATSAGLIIEAPWSAHDESRIVVGCSIDARWANGNVVYTWGDPVDGSQGMATKVAPQTVFKDMSDYPVTDFLPTDNQSWIRIALDSSWLQMLTPAKLALDSQSNMSRLTTMELLLTNLALVDSSFATVPDQNSLWNNAIAGLPNRTLSLEWVTALLVADGISRYGSDKVLNTSGVQESWSLLDYQKRPDFDDTLLKGGVALFKPNETQVTSFNAGVVIQGMSYRAQYVTDYLSIAVLSTYILLALGHTVYIVYRRESSSAWDTITEMLTLAYNSLPRSETLENTSAGIESLDTFSKIATVRAVGGSIASSSARNVPSRRVQLIINDGEITDVQKQPLIARGDKLNSEEDDHRGSPSASGSTGLLNPTQPETHELELGGFGNSNDGYSFLRQSLFRRHWSSSSAMYPVEPDHLYS